MSELSLQWLAVAVDVSVKAVLLASVAALALRLARLGDSNLRHRVWTGVLIGMLLLPALSQMVPALQLPFPVPADWSINESADVQPAIVRDSQPASADESRALSVEEDAPLPLFAHRAFEELTQAQHGWRDAVRFSLPMDALEAEAGPAFDTAHAIPPFADKVEIRQTEVAAILSAPVDAPRAARWPVALLGLWLAVTGLMALRLVIGLGYSLRLVRASTSITADELIELDVDPQLLSDGRRSVSVWECPLIGVPLALGVLRPRILLPSEWPAWPADKLHAVIAHERTHIQRADGAVIFMAEINRCLYWFHPLAWWLRTHLGRLAETACDDAAIESTGDHATYARHLLEVAATVSGHRRLITVGISMARPSDVEARINTILDLTRPLSQRLTWTTTLLLLGMLIPLITVTAAVRPATNALEEQSQNEILLLEEASTGVSHVESATTDVGQREASAGSDSKSTREPPPHAPVGNEGRADVNTDRVFVYAGTVVDEQGRPVAGARITLHYWRTTLPPLNAPPLATTDDQGNFEFTRRLSDFSDARDAVTAARETWPLQATLIAQKPGYGLATGVSAGFETSGEFEQELQRRLEDSPSQLRHYLERLLGQPSNVLTLVSDDVPVRGRIVNTEGQPIAGVKIEAVNVYEGVEGTLEAWEKESARPSATYFTASPHVVQVTFNNTLSGLRSVGIHPVLTDDDGRFTLKGVGRERIAEIRVSGPGIETRMIGVRTRTGDVVKLALSERSTQDLGEYVYYPCEFTHVAAASVPVEGRVTDATTGAPLAGITIATSQLAAMQGSRHLSASPADVGAAWKSDVLKIMPDTEYRLEGWIRVHSGSAWLEVQFLNQEGRPSDDRASVVARTPAVENIPDWRYSAVEVNSSKAAAAQIVLHARGEADFDQVLLAPIAVSYMGNKGAEVDDRGRIGFFEDEVSFDVIPGQPRGGTRIADDVTKREGENSLLLEPQSGEHYMATATLGYDIFDWTDRVRLSAWARCRPGASAHLAACWIDSARRTLRVDLGPESTGTEWQRWTFEPPAPPEDAASVRLVAVANHGPVWFDDFDIQFLQPHTPLVRVFVNQVGYDAAVSKRAMIATNFFPRDGHARWEVRDASGMTVSEGAAVCAGRIHSATPDDWGWYFWPADFSSVKTAGAYHVAATASAGPGRDVQGESPPFVVGSDVLLSSTAPLGVDFFFVQRCGFEVPGWHGLCHMDCVKLPDGTHLDATGGWHTAGDYNKPMYQFGDSAAVFALAVLFDQHRDELSKYDRNEDGIPDALDEAWWGAKFLAKMQREDGSLWGDVMQGPGRDWTRWARPEVHTDNQIGTADDPVINPDRPTANAPLAVAGWVRVGKLLDERGIPNDYVERAVRLWDYSTTESDRVGDGLLFFGALELLRATGDDRYREYLDASLEAFLSQQRSDGRYPGDSGDHGDWVAAALASFALQYPDDPQTPQIRESLGKYLDFCLSRADSIFGLTLQANDPVHGRDLYFHPTVTFGVNFWLLGRAWAAALIHQLTGDKRARAYAVDQLDWVFGKNPTNLCMFEGLGLFNPPRYHHRYNQIPGKERGAVPGAIANGFVRDMGLADRPGFDLSTGGSRAPSYRTSEPFLVHNVTHLLAVSALSGGSARSGANN